MHNSLRSNSDILLKNLLICFQELRNGKKSSQKVFQRGKNGENPLTKLLFYAIIHAYLMGFY